MIEKFKFIQGNTKEGLDFTVKNGNDQSAVDITGATITLRIVSQDFVTFNFSKICTIISGPAGTCNYTPNATDFNNIGNYVGELEILFADTTIGRIQGIHIIVAPKAPTS